MADGQQPATASATSSAPDTTPLSYPDFAAKIRARDSRLTPELVDDTTLVNKVLERVPQLKQYVAGEPPKPPALPEGLRPKRARVASGQSPEEQKAAADIDAVLNNRQMSELSYPERYQVLSILSKEFARQHAEKGKASKSWMEKAKDYMLTMAGVDIDVSSRITGAVTEPKNVAIGSAALVPGVGPYAVAGYFAFEGATRLPGEARKAVADPSYENLVSAGLTASQVLGGATGVGEAAKGKVGAGRTEPEIGAKAGLGQRIIQKMAGTDPGLAKGLAEEEIAAREKTANKTTELQENLATTKSNLEENLKVKTKRLAEDYGTKVDNIKRNYADNVAKREKAIAEAEAEYVQQVSKVIEEHKRELAKAGHERTGQALIEAHRQKLESQEKGLADDVLNNVKNTGELIKKDFDARWADARKIAGANTPMDPAATKSIIEEARQGLHGVPADLTLFNQIMNEIEGQQGGEQGEDTVGPEGGEPLKPQTWDAMRDQFSALGKKMYSGDLPGNVYNALKLVRDGFRPGQNAETPGVVSDPRSFDAQLTGVMDRKGAGAVYKQLKSDYSQYMHDWYDTRSIPGGNGPESPLARLYQSVDPATTIRHTTGPFTDRLVKQFGKYDKFGAAPSVIDTLRNNNFELTKLMKFPKPKYVPQPELPAMPSAEKVEKLQAEPVKPPGEIISRVEKTRDIKITRAEEDTKRKIAQSQEDTKRKIDRLDKGRTPEEILAALKDLKQEKIAAKLSEQATLTKHDRIMIAIATALGIETLTGKINLIKYAPIYLAYRLGETAAFRNPKFQEALGRITDKDIEELNKIYEKNPAEKAEAQRVFAGGLEARAKQGLPAPPLNRFSKFLREDQMRRVLRAYVPYGQKREVPQRDLEIAPPSESPMQVTVQ